MISNSKLRYLRIAPRKVRLVADLIRGKKVEKAQKLLAFTRKRAASPMLKLLNQAVANAKNNFQTDENNLYISKLLVDEGIKLKRQLPRARGRADIIYKKSSHITLVLDEIDKKAKKAKKKKVVEKKPESVKKEPVQEEEKEKKKVIEPVVKKERQKPDFEKIVKTKKERGLRRFFRRKAF